MLRHERAKWRAFMTQHPWVGRRCMPTRRPAGHENVTPDRAHLVPSLMKDATLGVTVVVP